jgi:hypothetical protein
MKKTLAAALTTALVLGAASTTFAAANPFSDVPADHWAYDAVSQLAKDGVIEGYGDTTFQGNKNITRYEMAQMVAKAMAKANVSTNDAALIDKLKAEFSDELNNLGVRVANLEKNADKVKWTGMFRYDYTSPKFSGHDGAFDKANRTSNAKFRLYPDAEINDHWHVQARLQAKWSPAGDAHMASDSTTDTSLSYAYAEGKYGDVTMDFGKMRLFSDADEGMLLDTMFSGAKVSFGNQLKAIVMGGRHDLGQDGYWTGYGNGGDTADYASLQLLYPFGKLNTSAAYHYLKSANFKNYKGYGKTEDEADLWTVGGRYTFDKNAALAGFYGQNADADSFDKSGSVEFDYKGSEAANQGTWGAYAAYRHVGQNVSFATTYDDMWENMKGYAVGASYVPFKNIILSTSYTAGKTLDTDKDANLVFGRVKVVW